MAFDLKRILKALLFSTSDPLTIRDIQGVVTRYHEREAGHRESESAEPEEPVAGERENGEAPASSAPADEIPESGPEPTAGEEEAGRNGVSADFPSPEPERTETSEVPSLVTATQIREAMEEIRAELDEKNEVFQLIEGHNGYRLVTRAEFAPWVRSLRGEPRPAKLSQAALETLAIIAYRQPVTRAEIEHIRGVSADGAVNKLLERELVEVKGRADLPGRPIQYGVSEKFLDFVGIKSLEELPASDVLSPRQIDEWIQEASKGHALSDREVGLPED